jgi:2-oxoglutarate dehydrogenase E2 component (dihydrolipoamide succinyltransferase)
MSSQVEIRAPAEQTEGTRSQILRWLKAVGDSVTEHEPLIEIETDKVTVEVASPGSGTLREIFKHEQEEIGPGDLLGRIEAAGAAMLADSRTSADVAPMRPENALGQNDGALGATVRSSSAPGPTDGAFGAAIRSSSAPGPTDGVLGAGIRLANAPGPSNGPAAAAIQHMQDAGAVAPEPGPAARTLSPAVRRLLAERGLDASQVRGTGQGGRITVEDILGHSVSGAAQTSRASSSSTPPVAAAADLAISAAAGPSHRVPHTAIRKRIAEHMVQSLLHTAPHVTTVFEADLTAVLEHRQRNKDDFARRGAPLTLTAYFLQATVAAIRAVPEANSRWTDAALEIFDFVNIGVATALDSGLVVPVLRDVQSRDLFETAQGLEDLVSRARDGRLSPADVRGGTFTISNHGVSGSLVATPIIINQPQAAILGIGKLEKRPVVVSEDGVDRIVVRPRCYVTLTIDHRVMDGHQANRFLQTFVERLATSPS